MRRKLLLLFLALFVVILVLVGGRFTTRRPGKQTVSAPHPPIRFFCPVAKEYCQQGMIITVKGQYAGVGYTLPLGAELYAVFSGGLRPGWAVSSNGRKPLIILENKEKQMVAVYQITGPDFTQYEAVKQGEKIGEAQEEGNIDQSGANLIIYIWHLDNKTKPMIPVKPSDFISL